MKKLGIVIGAVVILLLFWIAVEADKNNQPQTTQEVIEHIEYVEVTVATDADDESQATEDDADIEANQIPEDAELVVVTQTPPGSDGSCIPPIPEPIPAPSA